MKPPDATGPLALIILVVSSVVAAITVVFGVVYLLIHAVAYLLGSA